MRRYSLYFAWLIASLGTLFSLYYSEILAHIPCKFCWYQRICLFPLPLLLFPVIIKQKHEIAPYFLPLPLAGLGASLFICRGCFTQPLAVMGIISFALIAGFLLASYCSSSGLLSKSRRG